MITLEDLWVGIIGCLILTAGAKIMGSIPPKLAPSPPERYAKNPYLLPPKKLERKPLESCPGCGSRLVLKSGKCAHCGGQRC